MNRSIVKFMVAAAMVGLTLVVMAGCGGGQEKTGAERRAERKAEMGPEGTVEAFCRAVAGGDFATAKALCDTVAMNGYLERYAEALDAQVRRDSGAVAIAAAELAKTVFTVDDIVRDGENRHVHYTICAGEGMSKKKTATVKKIEGVWKVEEITDRP
jgi:hypothetical protein